MTENDFLKQLKNLQNIDPDTAWLKSNREILLSQINNSGVKELSSWRCFVINVRSFMQAASQPAMAFASLLLVLVGASAFGHLAFNKTKPNDSLYIARIISEKAKLNTVFNAEERDKMEVKFATDHAEAITEVLANTAVDAGNQDQVAQLNESFNKEIDTARTKIVAINNKKNTPAKTAVPAPIAAPAKTPAAVKSEDDTIVAAGNGKVEAGTQLLINNNGSTETATKTEAVKTEAPAAGKAAENILDEAKTLFDNKDYDSALNKLKEVKEMIK